MLIQQFLNLMLRINLSGFMSTLTHIIPGTLSVLFISYLDDSSNLFKCRMDDGRFPHFTPFLTVF